MDTRQKTILQATMGLDIGGAETHIVELSLELQKRGYRVIVASNGGVYESLLNEKGIETVRIPMHTRNLSDMITSLSKLKALMKKESIDIVHSHARIPSFLLSILKKSMKFEFITTAHGVFQVNKLLKVMTNWGDEVFAISEDIKSYLIENYDISKENIHMNINGINLDRFKRKDESSNRKSIVHISRLEPDTSKVAYMLSDYGIDNLDQEIIIVGDGSELEALKQKTKGHDNIVFAGKTSDVTGYLEKGGLFVGISRAALEAMCYNIPVILAGNYGYMGILDKSKLKIAEHNNFTARETDSLEYETLASDIDILRLNHNYSDYLWYREYIKEKYSVEKMVDNYEKVYRKYLGV
jgi:glycosyltransferase involved in cell wall biosynthesis